jgi:hypothetical protein
LAPEKASLTDLEDEITHLEGNGTSPAHPYKNQARVVSSTTANPPPERDSARETDGGNEPPLTSNDGVGDEDEEVKNSKEKQMPVENKTTQMQPQPPVDTPILQGPPMGPDTGTNSWAALQLPILSNPINPYTQTGYNRNDSNNIAYNDNGTNWNLRQNVTLAEDGTLLNGDNTGHIELIPDYSTELSDLKQMMQKVN